MTLLFGIDPNFVVPLAVTLHSLLDGLEDDDPPDVYVLAPDVGPAGRSLVEQVVAGRAQLVWPDLDPALVDLDRLPTTDNLTVAAHYRVLLLDLLPADVDRAIYIDADTVVRGDLRPLWSIDLEGATAAAVRDPAVHTLGGPRGLRRWREVGLDPDAPFFNSGVLVIDVERWRRSGKGSDYAAYTHQWGQDSLGADQDALNVILHGEWLELDPRWNLQTEVLQRAEPRHYEPAHTAWLVELRQRRSAVAEEPYLVHYTRARKPWHPRCPNTHRHLWHESARASGAFSSALAYRRWLAAQWVSWGTRRARSRDAWTRVGRRARRVLRRLRP